MGYKKGMKDLYERLSEVGFDRSFLIKTVLPDWWDDSLAENPADRAIAEFAVARQLGFSLESLSDPNSGLRLELAEHCRLKRSKTVKDVRELAPAMAVARRISQLLAKSLKQLPEFPADITQSEARAEILRRENQVDLRGLLDLCWGLGIVVFHIARLPKKTKKFQGIAMTCEGRPYIGLSFGSDSPPWLAFHLAHELCHVLLKHLTGPSELLVDEEITQGAEDEQELETDEAAGNLLIGRDRQDIDFIGRWKPDELARVATAYAAECNANVGSIILYYGKERGDWTTAQLALRIVGEHTGALQMIRNYLQRNLIDDIPETTARFLSGVLQIDI